MPHESLKDILDRDFQKVQAKDIIDAACTMLREIVNYGTRVFGRCSASTKDSEPRTSVPPDMDIEGRIHDEHMPILLLYYHVLEMIDAVEVCLSQSSVVPARTHLRSAFEGLLQLEWILKDNTVQRAYAYLVSDVRDRVAIYKQLDPNTQESRQLRATIASDNLSRSIGFPTISNIQNRIQNLENLLKKTQFDVVNQEFNRNPKLSWYAQYDGPRSIEQLAHKLQRPFQYWMLYREWSGTIHGQNLMREKVLPSGAFWTLRCPLQMPQAAVFAATFGIDATRLILNFYRPDEIGQFNLWYKEEISKTYNSSDRI